MTPSGSPISTASTTTANHRARCHRLPRLPRLPRLSKGREPRLRSGDRKLVEGESPGENACVSLCLHHRAAMSVRPVSRCQRHDARQQRAARMSAVDAFRTQDFVRVRAGKLATCRRRPLPRPKISGGAGWSIRGSWRPARRLVSTSARVPGASACPAEGSASVVDFAKDRWSNAERHGCFWPVTSPGWWKNNSAES
jgi:hypothetical protein